MFQNTLQLKEFSTIDIEAITDMSNLFKDVDKLLPIKEKNIEKQRIIEEEFAIKYYDDLKFITKLKKLFKKKYMGN